MITNVSDLELVLSQCDPGVILVGPLLGLSVNSSYRYCYIAGNGSKVFWATIGIAFVESETAAQRQRADIVEGLERRFAQVLSFDSDVAMLQAARARWPNEKTITDWTSCAPAAKSDSTMVSARQLINELPDDYDKPPVDAQESVDNAGDVDAVSWGERPSSRDRAQPRRLSPIILRFCAIGGVAALAVWKIVLPSATHVGALPVPDPASLVSVNRGKNPPPAGGAATPSVPKQAPDANALTLQVIAAPAGVSPSPKSQPSQVATPEAAAAPTTVPPAPQSRPSQVATTQAAVPPSVPAPLPKSQALQLATAQAAAASATSPPLPRSQPPHVASTQDQPALISRPGSALAKGSDSIKRIDAAEVAMLVSRGTDFLKAGDFASARLLLRRAAEAGSPSAALMLGTTFDPLFLPQLGPTPDVEQARHWYEKAAELGADGALERLANLQKIGK
jgi:cytoskeletal protein RodZ